MKNFSLILILSFGFLTIKADIEYYKLSGIVVDKSTGEPLPFSSIYTTQNIGTVSNDLGEFLIKLKTTDSHDTLVVNYLGYSRYFLPLFGLKSLADLRIELIPLLVQLKEVEIRPVDPDAIIDQAIERIPYNYFIKPIGAKSFYRLTTNVTSSFELEKMKKKLPEKEIREGILDVYQSAYPLKSNKIAAKNQIKLIHWRKVGELSDTLHKMFSNPTPNSVLGDDPVKNLIDNLILSPKNRKNYDFKFKDMSGENTARYYIIEFDQKDGVEELLYKGNIFIDMNSLAIISMNYSFSPKGFKYDNKVKILGIEFKPNTDTYVVAYKRLANKWVLNFIRTNSSMDINIYKNFLTKKIFKKSNNVNAEKLSFNIKEKQEMIFDQIDTIHVVQFPKTELFENQIRAAESKASTSKQGEEIWENYNYIKD